jgi:Leucine-rich repeat (LRR) protein
MFLIFKSRSLLFVAIGIQLICLFKCNNLNRALLLQWIPFGISSPFIDLDNRQIETIDPDTFAGLTTLTYLELFSNKLTDLDYRVFNGLTGLKSLTLYNNLLRIIDSYTFRELISLEVLNLYNNKIIAIDFDVFVGLNNLKSVYFGLNPITSVQQSYVLSLCKSNPRCKIYI